MHNRIPGGTYGRFIAPVSITGQDVVFLDGPRHTRRRICVQSVKAVRMIVSVVSALWVVLPMHSRHCGDRFLRSPVDKDAAQRENERHPRHRGLAHELHTSSEKKFVRVGNT